MYQCRGGYFRLYSQEGNTEDVLPPPPTPRPPDQNKYEGDQGHKILRTLPRRHSGKYNDIEI